MRTRIDDGAVARIVDRTGSAGAEAAAAFMAGEQRSTVQSRRLREAVTHESGKDSQGWYARAGMKPVKGTAAFFWYFHEYQTGRGTPGRPFIRPSLWNNTRQVARLFTAGR